MNRKRSLVFLPLFLAIGAICRLTPQDGGLHAQHPAVNMLINPGFETLRDVPRAEGFLNADNFAYKVPGWQLIGAQPYLCTSGYAGDQVDSTGTHCADGQVRPYAGNAMLELDYNANCNAPWIERPGCAGYVGQKLTNPLAIGKVYEVSAMLYLQRPSHPTYARHIGISFYPELLAPKANILYAGNAFSLDTVLYEQWYRVTWKIRPLCDLRLLVFGVFRDEQGPPTDGEYSNNSYFLDDLSLREVPDTVSALTPFCRFRPLEKQEVLVAGTTLYFASGNALLSAEGKSALDAFANRVKANPHAIFKISGHTDQQGDNHLSLAQARIDSTLIYLRKKHRLTALRFLPEPMGTERPLGDERTELGRRQNRRVEISFLPGNPAALLYRHLLLSIKAGRLEQGRAWLLVWQRMATRHEVGLVTYDPRLRQLLDRQEVRSGLNARLAEMYPPGLRRSGGAFLDSLWREDQLYRTLGRYVENLPYFRYPADTSDRFWVVDFPALTPEEETTRNQRHLAVLEQWLMANEWPQQTQVGEKAAHAVPLILLHSGDTSRMAYYLPVLYRRCRAGEADWYDYALLFDRNKVLRGLPQRYGTQSRIQKDGSSELCPLEDPDNLGRRRRKLGLGAL